MTNIIRYLFGCSSQVYSFFWLMYFKNTHKLWCRWNKSTNCSCSTPYAIVIERKSRIFTNINVTQNSITNITT
ncbi:hypothetical protein ACQ27_gp089 [Klebsiella phage K64-1]|uniref:hypothetical protein n=1 Tax=Klebsiella phage K64-1 TaxID=1439894 RepID=UPI00248CEC1F|nr:hypothetical protein ACQ27_gp089 [Klebsiella phage K64-1]